jgi:hypothetical protein
VCSPTEKARPCPLLPLSLFLPSLCFGVYKPSLSTRLYRETEDERGDRTLSQPLSAGEYTTTLIVGVTEYRVQAILGKETKNVFFVMLYSSLFEALNLFFNKYLAEAMAFGCS